MAVSDGFAPKPVTIEINQQTDGVSAYDKGHRKCGLSQSTTTREPSYRFHLPRPMTDLRLTFDSNSFPVVEKDDGSYFCINQGKLWPKEWAAGEYRIYIYNLRNLRATVTFEQPQRIKAQVPGALAKTPLITQGKLVQNPMPGRYKPAALFERGTSGISCGSSTLAPIARLDVVRQSTWKFTSSRRVMLFDVARNACRSPADFTKLAPGRYQVWAEDHTTGALVAFSAQDRRAPMRFGDAPTFSLEPNAEGNVLEVISGKTTNGRGPIRVAVSPNLPTSPSFYLKGNGAKSISVKMLKTSFNLFDMKYHVYGPIETATADTKLRYNLDTLSLGSVSGTYAVFITRPKAFGAKFEALAFTTALAKDQHTLPRPIAPNLPPLERRLASHYPFYSPGASVEWFFRNAPKELFVVANETSGAVRAGEPLIVIRAGKTVEVARYDGTRHRLSASNVSGSAPIAASLPAKVPKLEIAKNVESAMRLGGPSEDAIIDKYIAAETKLNACVGKWMAKNDPTWGKSYELVNLRTGRTLSDQKFRKADRICGLKKVERAGKVMIREVNRSRKKNAAAYLAALKLRFR